MIVGLTNDIHKKVLILLFVNAVILIQVSSTTMLVKLEFSEENLILIGLFSLLLFNTTLGLPLVFGDMSGVYTRSGLVISRAKQHLGHLNVCKESRKLHAKFYKSCAVLGIRMGDINYFDRLTPLNCIDQANAMTVNILLLT